MSILRNKTPKGAFDLAKVLIVLGIPFVHVMMELIVYEYYDESLLDLAILITSLITFGGPVFFTCYGIDLANNRSYKNIIKTGIQVLIIALALNAVRNIPEDIAFIIVGESEPYIIPQIIFLNDTFVFIGLFTIFYGFAKKYNCPLWLLTLISIGLFGLNIYLSNNVITLHPVLSTFVANFVTGYEYCHFAFFGWCIFPCVGMYLNKIIKLDSNKRNISFGLILVLAIIVLVIGSNVLINNNVNPIELFANYAFYGSYDLPTAVLMLCMAMITLMSVYFIYQLVPTNKVEKTLIMGSNLIFPFYIVHFTLIYWLVLGPFNAYYIATGLDYPVSVSMYFIISIAIELISILICWKKGFSLTKWLFKVTDYSNWFKKKQVS